MLNPRRIDIHGHPTSFKLEPEYWGWLYEIAAKTGTTLKDIVEAIAAHRDYKRSLASEIRVAVAAYFHGSPLSDIPLPWSHSPNAQRRRVAGMAEASALRAG